VTSARGRRLPPWKRFSVNVVTRQLVSMMSPHHKTGCIVVFEPYATTQVVRPGTHDRPKGVGGCRKPSNKTLESVATETELLKCKNVTRLWRLNVTTKSERGELTWTQIEQGRIFCLSGGAREPPSVSIACFGCETTAPAMIVQTCSKTVLQSRAECANEPTSGSPPLMRICRIGGPCWLSSGC
jgi:hypothetical protein